MRRLAPLLCLTTLTLGCAVNYTELRFRPVDTTSQRTLEGVTVAVNGQTRATTDGHGIAMLSGLRTGDTILLSKPGYQSAQLKLGMGEYVQTSPAGDSSSTDDFTLNSVDAIPVPLHRDGAVRRP